MIDYKDFEKRVRIYHGVYTQADLDSPPVKNCSWVEDTNFLNLFATMVSLNRILKVNSNELHS